MATANVIDFPVAKRGPRPAKPARVPQRDLLLIYRAEDGAETARTVRIVRVRRAGAALLVEAHCRLRDAPRAFRVDRVVSLADLASGRVCPDPRAYLASLEESADPFAAFDRIA